ncbi:hypothetical protein [Streptomyces sp. W1SF4]|uniref:hypothetical protein n=1 Tax=Streptomyces sp. W1SF4 TaxID=2305220 RepID=UPI0013E04065|nr:hypothetical protein [Streptomyces sp. W1SF4]
MRTHHAITILATAGLLALTGCSSSTTASPGPSASWVRDTGTAQPAPGASGASANPDAARSAAGLPAEPKGPQRKAFLDGLNAIDKDIVHGKDDKAISRGIDTCAAIKAHTGDIPKQVEQTNQRWTSPTHPEGHGEAKAAQILAVVHTTICPTY